MDSKTKNVLSKSTLKEPIRFKMMMSTIYGKYFWREKEER
jgi:hypothetical protein